MTRRDAVWILSFLISGVLGLACYVQFFDRAFPVASLNFRVDRQQAYQAAEAYLHRLGYDLTEYESAQVFSHASLPQIFLERTLGLAEANRLVREWVSVWYWNIRYFKPLQKEELRVRIDPGGRIVGFTHSILESDEGTSLSEEDARHIAEAFLTDVQGFSLDAYEPIEASSIDRPQRRDHTFTYRKRDFVVGDDGHYRLHVTVQGDRVGSFSEYLKVPETFSRDYREIRTRAGLLTKVAGGFAFALAIAMIVVLVRKYRQRTLTWRVAVSIGILVGAVSLLGSINGYPLSLFGYDTMQSYISFILNFIFTGLLGAAVMALIVAVCGAAGGTAAQDVRDWSNPLERISLRRWRSAGFARVTLVGYGLAFAHLGYVTLFYILGNDYLFSLLSICLGLGFNYVWIGVALKVLVDRFQPLSGWTFPQLAFLYGLSLMSRGVISILSFQSRQIDRFVTRGEFDLMLLRPLEITFHFSCNRINVVGLVHLGIGTGYFLYGARLSGFVWTPLHVAEVLLVIAGEPLAGFAHAHAEILERRDSVVRIRFARNQVSASALIAELSARYPVRDVSIQEPDIEDVIRTVYGRDVGG